MAKNRKAVTKRVPEKPEKEEVVLPKTAHSSIATRNKWDLQTAASQRRKQEKEGRAARNEGAVRVSSRKVGELRGESFGESAQVIRARRNIRIAIISSLLVVILSILGLGSVYNSDLFAIEYLSVKGVRHLTASEMTTLAAVPEDTTLLRVDTEAIRQRVLADAWVQDAVVQRVLPNTLEIIITERPIAAVVEISSSDATNIRRWAISTDGVWLMPIPDRDSEAGKLVSDSIYEDIEHVLTITDVPSIKEQPDIGTNCVDSYVNCALSIVSSLTTSLVDRIEKVVANNTASTTLVLTDGVEVVFGDDSDERRKEKIILELLDKYQGKIVYINVSVPDNTTYRTL